MGTLVCERFAKIRQINLDSRLVVMRAGCLLTSLFLVLAIGCDTPTNDSLQIQATESSYDKVRDSRLSEYRPKLSDYQIFEQPMADLRPADDVFQYELNTTLFSDYSNKQRLIKLPTGSSMSYSASGTLKFPIGTLIAKTFYYPGASGAEKQIVETRILEHRPDGWVGIPYVWNENQTDAVLSIAGKIVPVCMTTSEGECKFNYRVPNMNDCNRCHLKDEVSTPIGPQANNLNRDVESGAEATNQLQLWAAAGRLNGLPKLEDVPQIAKWDDESCSLESRARAYLDVNCAHCHNKLGPARSSGLHLDVVEDNPYHWGVMKSPVAAGKGTGGRTYGIVPGKPDESILLYRMQTDVSDEAMPEFGRSLIHKEGVELIRNWIEQLDH